MSGYVYLIQPESLLGTDRFKLGRSHGGLGRLASYGKRTRIIGVVEVPDVKSTERSLVNLFRRTFKTVCGHEYFEGDIAEAQSLFVGEIDVRRVSDVCTDDCCDVCGSLHYCQVCDECRVCCAEGETLDEIREKIREISEVFPNYKDDVSYGGPERLVAIDSDEYGFDITYIHHDRELSHEDIRFDDSTHDKKTCSKRMEQLRTEEVPSGRLVINLTKPLFASMFKDSKKIKLGTDYPMVSIDEMWEKWCASDLVQIMLTHDFLVNKKFPTVGCYREDSDELYGFAFKSYEYYRSPISGMSSDFGWYIVCVTNECMKANCYWDVDSIKRYLPYLISSDLEDMSKFTLSGREYWEPLTLKHNATGKHQKYVYTDGTRSLGKCKAEYEKLTEGCVCLNMNPITERLLGEILTRPKKKK